MKLIILTALYAVAMFAQPRASFNSYQLTVWNFVGATSVQGELQCSADSRSSCADVVAAWKKFNATAKDLTLRDGGIRALDKLLEQLSSGTVAPKTGCSDWNCGDSIAILARMNALKELGAKAQKEYTREIIQASAKDDGLADFLAAQAFK